MLDLMLGPPLAFSHLLLSTALQEGSIPLILRTRKHLRWWRHFLHYPIFQTRKQRPREGKPLAWRQQLTDQNLIPRLPDLHALSHSCFLPSKIHASHSTNSCWAFTRLQRVAGETTGNMMSPRTLAGDQLMGERQTLKVPSLPRAASVR